MKMTKIPGWERGQLGIGAQFFNVFNHPNFDQPVGDVASGAFGQTILQVASPTSILGSFLGGDNSPRLIQIKAQIVFKPRPLRRVRFTPKSAPRNRGAFFFA